MHLTVTADAVRLDEPDVFTAFHVVVDAALPRDRVDSVLRDREVGELAPDGEHVLVAVDALRRLAAPAGPGWEDDFAAMLAYADRKGWLERDGTRVRAHVETPG